MVEVDVVFFQSFCYIFYRQFFPDAQNIEETYEPFNRLVLWFFQFILNFVQVFGDYLPIVSKFLLSCEQFSENNLQLLKVVDFPASEVLHFFLNLLDCKLFELELLR